MSAQHAGVEISLRIGQRVRHRDYKGRRVTGVVCCMQVVERALMVDCALDAPIVIPADKHGPAIDIHRQYAPAHEFSPFDDRDELIEALLKALKDADDADMLACANSSLELPAGQCECAGCKARAAIAKAEGP
jgi:hypothetical protein